MSGNLLSVVKFDKLAKGRIQNMGFYTPFLVPKRLWEDVSMDFILDYL